MPKVPTKLSEAAIQKDIIDWLKLNGLHVHRINAGMLPMGYKGKQYMVQLAETGHCDLVVELPDGRNGYFEVKNHGGKATKSQLDFLTRQMNRGCPAAVVRSILGVQEVLEDYGLKLRVRV